MYDLEDFERVVWREEGSIDRFNEWFFEEPEYITVKAVAWETARMYVMYYQSMDVEWTYSSFTWSVWKEFYNKYK